MKIEVFLYQWLKLCIGLDVEADIQILIMVINHNKDFFQFQSYSLICVSKAYLKAKIRPTLGTLCTV